MENGRKGVCAERACEGSKTKGGHSKKVQDKEVERVEDRRPRPIKSPFEVFRGSPRGREDLFDFRTRNLRKKVWAGGRRSRPKFPNDFSC